MSKEKIEKKSEDVLYVETPLENDWNLTPINPQGTLFRDDLLGAIFSLEDSLQGKILRQLNKGHLRIK